MIESSSSQKIGLPEGARIIPLHGFSGCDVFLVDSGQGVYVRKLARDLGYNARLLRQAEKQSAFRGDEWFCAVKTRASGHLESGIAYIDMDYVPGVTAAETFQSLPLSEVQRWTSMLLRFADAPKDGTIDPAVFHKKLADLQQDLETRGMLISPVIDVLAKLRSRTWTDIPRSPCHGDLTLENIIVHDGKLHLIDFLDSFADSWYLDMSKLLQDLIGGWSFRHKSNDRNLILRLASLRHTLEAALETRHPGCLKPILDLYSLGLLRILPYCSSSGEQSFVESRLSAALANFL